LESERAQLRYIVRQRLFQVIAHKEGCVGEARPDHVLVAVHHHIQPFFIPIAHGDKVGQQVVRVGGICHREITLVLFHHRNQHLTRQLEIFLAKCAAQSRGRFHQVRHFGEQCRVIEDRPAHSGGQRLHLIQDDCLAPGLVQQDTLGCQGGKIFRRRFHLDFRRFQEAQTARAGAGTQPGVRERRHGIGLARADQRQQPADGARKSDVAAVPTHGFIHAQPGDQTRQRFRQHLLGGFASLAYHRRGVPAAVHLAHLQITHSNTLAAGKALTGFGERAAGIESPVGGRPLDHLLQVGLHGSQVFHIHHQAPGSAVDLQAAV